ncbi:MAG: diguanylate cyclase [Oscillatoriales cyanobacterium SM2_1_8]|nr:diguanylate cyclase [Oscillatoriales cyanobacterium SM2_1_8]
MALYREDTFALLLPDTDETGTLTVARNAHRAIADLGLPFDVGTRPHISLSVGIAATVPALGSDPSSFLQTANHALQKAQQMGGDRLFPSS